MNCRNNIEKMLNKIEKSISKLKMTLKNAPKGHIVCKFARGTTRLYQISDNSSPQYLGKDKIETIRSLAQKRYDEVLLEALRDEEDILSDTFIALSKSKKRKALENFPDELKPYVTLSPMTNEGYIQEWSNSYSYTLPERYKYKEPYQTLKGEITKSKSEVIIADRLHLAGIPYHYEEDLELNKGATFRKPDFTILHPYTLELYYWEHFGLMDQEDYRNKAKAKIELYAANGIIQEKNFITTFETNLSPLNTWYVDKLIKEYFKKED